MKFWILVTPFLWSVVDSFSLQRRQLIQGGASSIGFVSNSNSRNTLSQNTEPNSGSEEVGILQETYNELYFYGPVNQRSCVELKRQIKDMDIKLKTLSIQYQIGPPPIHLHIQSQ